MKRIVVFSLIVLFISCAGEQNLSPEDTAKIVAESFYHNDKATLKKYTTESGFSNLSSIQAMFVEDKDSAVNFIVIDESMDNDVSWIKYTTTYDTKPGVFKLVKVGGQWKVTHNGPREKGPF